jgi:hypothetical protein
MSEHQEVIPPTRPTPFTVFSAITNEVLRSGVCQYASLTSQPTAPDEIVIEGDFPDNMYRIEVNERGPTAVPTQRRPRTKAAQPEMAALRANLDAQGIDAYVDDALNGVAPAVRTMFKDILKLIAAGR